MNEKKPTTEDEECLALMPDDWFTPNDLPYPRIKRAGYRCERLQELGLLDRRVVGDFPNLRSEYRKLPQQP